MGFFLVLLRPDESRHCDQGHRRRNNANNKDQRGYQDLPQVQSRWKLWAAVEDRSRISLVCTAEVRTSRRTSYFPFFFVFRHIKKAEDRIASLEEESEENKARITDLEVHIPCNQLHACLILVTLLVISLHAKTD